VCKTMKIPLARLESRGDGEACVGARKALGIVWRAGVVVGGVGAMGTLVLVWLADGG